MEIENSKILITGGTGSFGRSFVNHIVHNFPSVKRLVVFSRDELKQFEMQQLYPEEKFPQLRFFLGDIRDQNRLKTALNDIDIVIHAAALKHVPIGEYNPIEFIKTNVIGSENLAIACMNSNVKKVIALSTDKACSPVNLYGASKLCADKLFVASNNTKGFKNIKFSVVRYGNVMGSRGSVIPFFINKAKTGILPITDKSMTRFNIILDEAVEMVVWALKNCLGGEIFVPKIPSYRILDLAEAIGPSCKHEYIGLRPGEKIHEEMISKSDGPSTIDLGKYYAILPSDQKLLKLYEEKNINFSKVESNFYLDSKNNDLISPQDLRKIIKLKIDKNFKPI
ncbi:MAG: UDP-N-acetylglucosamine 4,6-dehydratase (inverting) [Prochlorococcus marinus XMU1428]|nr:UDP-N-acetylglucosamine 4,6-dehydratase (inverting) [Prochlorococcus marinus XMU1428]